MCLLQGVIHVRLPTDNGLLNNYKSRDKLVISCVNYSLNSAVAKLLTINYDK